MAPLTDSKTNSKSPPAKSKIQDGKIDKFKLKKPETKTPNYSIAGRTFACDACKKGHRVSKCTHALQRPVHMTNDPGRPSADQKRHCDCPRNCSCTTKNCKCERHCSCTQVMYMLVYIPVEKQAEKGDPKIGQWRIEKEVITDLKGNELSAMEIEERKQLKSLQKNGQFFEPGLLTATSSPNSKMFPDFPSSRSRSPTIDPTTAKSCCTHRKAVEESTPSSIKQEPISVSEPNSRPRCNCGTGCSCAFCLDHPNNPTSQRIAKQQIAQFAGQKLSVEATSWQADMNLDSSGGVSCMGTNPHFAMYSNPNPSAAELQTLFGANTPTNQGYFLSYPVTGPMWDVSQPDLLVDFSATDFSIPPLERQSDAMNYPASSLLPDTELSANLATAHQLFPDNTHLISSIPIFQPSTQIDFSTWGVGDASVSSTYGNPPGFTSPTLQWTTPIHGDLWPLAQPLLTPQPNTPLPQTVPPNTNHEVNANTIPPLTPIILDNEFQFDFNNSEFFPRLEVHTPTRKNLLKESIYTPPTRSCCQTLTSQPFTSTGVLEK